MSTISCSKVIVSVALAFGLAAAMFPASAWGLEVDPSDVNHVNGDGIGSTKVTIDLSGYNILETEVKVPVNEDRETIPIIGVTEETIDGPDLPWQPVDKKSEVEGAEKDENLLVAPDRPSDGKPAIAVEVILTDKNDDGVYDHIVVIPHYPLPIIPGGPSWDDPDVPPFINDIYDSSDPEHPVDPDKILDNATIIGGKLDEDGKIVPDPCPDGKHPDYFELDVRDENGDGVYETVTVIPHYPPEWVDENKNPIDDVVNVDKDGNPIDKPPAVSKDPNVTGAEKDPDTDKWVVPSKDGKDPDWIEVIYGDPVPGPGGTPIVDTIIVIPHYPPDVIHPDGTPIPDVEWKDADGNPLPGPPKFCDPDDLIVEGGSVDPDRNIVVPDQPGKKLVSVTIVVLEVDENGHACKIRIDAVWEDDDKTPLPNAGGDEGNTKVTISGSKNPLSQTGDENGMIIGMLGFGAVGSLLAALLAGKRRKKDEAKHSK